MKQHPQQRHGVFSSFILLGTVLLGISRMMMQCHAACSSCLVSTAVPFLLQHHHRHPPSRRGWTPTGATRTSAAPFGIMVARHVRSRISKLPHNWRLDKDATSEETTNDETETKDKDKDKDDSATTDGETFDVTSASMVFAIGLYKNFISPLLPPACRFLPTCSQYGVQAIEDFGPSKGGILTAWRILRCSPVGGRGYDPPKWPPVAYNYASY